MQRSQRLECLHDMMRSFKARPADAMIENSFFIQLVFFIFYFFQIYRHWNSCLDFFVISVGFGILISNWYNPVDLASKLFVPLYDCRLAVGEAPMAKIYLQVIRQRGISKFLRIDRRRIK